MGLRNMDAIIRIWSTQVKPFDAVRVVGVLSAVSGALAVGCPFQPDYGAYPLPSAGSTTTPEECVPSENPGVAVSNDCGVFASASNGDDSAGDGTKEGPFKTLATAFKVANASGKPVYACIEIFAEAVQMPAGAELYGGLDCNNDWLYVGVGEMTWTAISPPANIDGTVPIPLTLSSGDRTTIVQDVVVESADAILPGGSSIAVIVDGTTAAFTRCELKAGEGAAGQDGESLPADPSLDGKSGNPGNWACSADLVTGADPITQTCGNVDSISGAGGDGYSGYGGPGAPGLPALGAGQGGMGQPPSGSWSCSIGGAGNDGAPGNPGDAGAGAMGMGTLSASGYTGVAGQDGKPGTPGQGGGGGGGTKGGSAICSGNAAQGGASGGSGGTGGCGGKGGPGGGPGGASIALVSLNASVTLTDCKVYAREGGNGGQGAAGQSGGFGGNGGPGGTAPGSFTPLACAGGKGGQGGVGGPGGGGLGGPSIGIAYTGNAPEQRNVIIVPEFPASGGLGGDGNIANNAGAPGEAADVKAF